MPEDQPRPQRLTSILAGLSHAAITGCTIGALYFGFAQPPPLPTLRSPAALSPTLEYVISDLPSLELHTIASRSLPVPLGNGAVRNISSQGNYITIQEGTRLRLATSTGASIPLPPNEGLVVFPDEKRLALLQHGQLSVLNLCPLTTLASTQIPPIQQIRSDFSEFLKPHAVSNLHISPDSTTLLLITSYNPASLIFWDPAHQRAPRHHRLDAGLISGSWVRGNQFIGHVKTPTLDTITLFDRDTPRILKTISPHETFLGSTPLHAVFLTTQSKEPRQGSCSAVFQTLEGAILSQIPLSGPVSSCAIAPDGTFALYYPPRKQSREQPCISIIRPPRFTLDDVIPNATTPFFTPQGMLTYCALERGFTTDSPEICAYNPSTTIHHSILPPYSLREQQFRYLAYAGALLLPITLMGVWACTRRHRENLTAPSMPDWILQHPASTILPASACLTGLVVYAQSSGLTPSGMLAYTLPVFSTALAWGTLVPSFLSFLTRFKPPVVPHILQLAHFVLHSSQATADSLSEAIDLTPAEYHLARAHDEHVRHRYAHANLQLLYALERSHSPVPPPFSYFHALSQLITTVTGYIQFQYDTFGEHQHHQASWLRWHQVKLASWGHTSAACDLTDRILELSAAEEPTATLHQARMHTQMESTRSQELWDHALTILLEKIPPDAFIPVPGGTSEVVQVPESLNPYAEKTISLKRDTDHHCLLRELDITTAISKATNGYMSSMPLSTDLHSPQGTPYAYLPLLLHNASTLRAWAASQSHADIIAFLHDEGIPSLVEYHTLLESASNRLRTTLLSLDYPTLYLTKFVQRVSSTPATKQKLFEAGQPVLAYLSGTEQVPIHNNLHSGNIITGSPITFIDPADAGFGHPFLDVAHLVHDPYLSLDIPSITQLMNRYRAIRSDPLEAYRAQDLAATWLRLCHLVGRDVAYRQPHELAWHARGLERVTRVLIDTGIPGVDQRSMQPVIDFTTTH